MPMNIIFMSLNIYTEEQRQLFTSLLPVAYQGERESVMPHLAWMVATSGVAIDEGAKLLPAELDE